MLFYDELTGIFLEAENKEEIENRIRKGNNAAYERWNPLIEPKPKYRLRDIYEELGLPVSSNWIFDYEYDEPINYELFGNCTDEENKPLIIINFKIWNP